MNKRSIQVAIATIIAAALVWWLLDSVSVLDILGALGRVGPVWLAVSFVLYLLSTLIRGARFKMLFRQRVSFWKMSSIVFLHNLSNNLLPSFLGELSFIYLSKNTGKTTVGEATAVLILSRFFDILAVFVLTVIAMMLVPDVPAKFQTLVWSIGAFFIVIVVILLLAVIFRLRFCAALERVVQVLRLGHVQFFRWALTKLHETMEALELLHSVRTYSLVAIVSVAVWMLMYVQTYVLLIAMGYNVTFLASVLGTSLWRLATSLPVYGIAGFGTIEITWTAAFVLLGMGVQEAIVSGFAVHILILIYSLLLGAIGSLAYLRKAPLTT